jgi:cyclopropane-fatty-acyl-phospholipid synthase
MRRILDATLSDFIRRGDVHVRFADGSGRRYGDATGPAVGMHLTSAAAERRLLIDPELALGELYADGALRLTHGTLAELLQALMANAASSPLPPWARGLQRLRTAARRFAQRNGLRRAARNVAHHYDLDREFYRLFLDRDLQYSCAYFERPDIDIEAAQLAKKRHIAAKLALRSGQRVLDIGCGFGGLALTLAEETSVAVTGITLSQTQLAVARERAASARLPVVFESLDYRCVKGQFDRIVSVGMFEHVGVPHHETFFRRVASLLTQDGVALIHTIGRLTPPGTTNPFIAKYIFPGGYIPSLSETAAAIERAGLVLTDVEVLRLHYAHTLAAWRERFTANRALAVAMTDERFARIWEFYLAASEAAFRSNGLVVFQLQLTKTLDTLPITRDYIAEAEQRLRGDGDPLSRIAAE